MQTAPSNASPPLVKSPVLTPTPPGSAPAPYQSQRSINARRGHVPASRREERWMHMDVGGDYPAQRGVVGQTRAAADGAPADSTEEKERKECSEEGAGRSMDWDEPRDVVAGLWDGR